MCVCVRTVSVCIGMCMYLCVHILCVRVCVFCVTCMLQLYYCRVCVVVLVKDNSEYNDTVTRAFRELSVSSLSEEQVSFSYLDVDRQEDFVQSVWKSS